MASAIEEYLSARAEFIASRDGINSLANFLGTVAQALRAQPDRMIFSNTGPGLPMEASMSRDSVSINAHDWRSAQQIQELLAAYHTSREKVRNAWSAVPEQMKAGLQPLPDGAAHKRY